MDNRYDLVIIGGGAAGMAAAVYAGRAGRKTLLLEKGSYGGRINETIEVRNYPGTLSESGLSLMERFKAHALSYATNEFKHTTVTAVEQLDNGDYVVRTRRRGDFEAPCVILDLGTKPRILGIPGELEFAGRGVAYCATCDAELFRGKHIYVLGAGDQAIEEAGYLTGFASKVTVIVLHEEGCLDCNEIAAEAALKNPQIEFVWNSELKEIKGTDKVESLVIKNVVTGEKSEVETDGIFSFVGMIPQSELVEDLIACDDNGYIEVDEEKRTSLPGLYAVGDCTRTFLRQVVTAAADGAVAATSSERYVKEKRLIDHMLGSDSGKVAFIFYNPYDCAHIEAVADLEKQYGSEYRLVRQDVTRQTLLCKRLNLSVFPATAFYLDGRLIRTEGQCLCQPT